jgi:glucokinase
MIRHESVQGDGTIGNIAAVLDIGGTKVAAGLITESGRLIDKISVPTDQRSAQAVIDTVLGLVGSELERSEQEVVGIGVSVAGAVDRSTGTVRWAPNIAGWQDIPLGRLLREATHLPVLVGFDGHLTALGEHWKGAGQGVRDMVLLIIGTGIGGGLILAGELYRGADDLAGAAGWMITSPERLTSTESQAKGNLESAASGIAIAAAAEQMLRDGHASSLTSPVTAETVLQAAYEGDRVARTTVNNAGECIARAVVSIVSLLDPELVVLGGGVGSTGIFLHPVRSAVAAFAQPISRQGIRVESAQLGNDAGLFGAARAVFQHTDQSLRGGGGR